ncbi:MAG: hypothetical protein IPL83_07225 [Bdellovibrionales bacterium]|nr:hypothetical protein [Bdellovibrionales bacterium]
MQKRNHQVARVIRILSWIEASSMGLTVQEVHGRLRDFGYKTCIRTVYRDIEAIQEAGFPLIDEKESDNRYLTRWRSFNFNKKAKANRFANRDFISIIILKGALLGVGENSANMCLRSAIFNFEANLSRDEKGHLDELFSVFRFEGNPLSERTISWDKLELCVLAAIGKIAVIGPDRSEIFIDKISFCSDSIRVSSETGNEFDLDQICCRPE